MHEAMRKRILRRLETLPETQLYQVLDYIEFLESRYNRGIPEETTALQKLAEKLEDGLRKGKVNPSNLREAFQLISTADRVLSSVSAAGRQLLDELQSTDEGGVSTRDVTRTSGTPGTRGVGTPGASSPRTTGVSAPRSPASPGIRPPAGNTPSDRDEG
jgi:hypothetical protein